MCLAAPAKVIKIEDDAAIVDFGGVKKNAKTLLVGDLEEGDYVIVHAGFVIEKMSEEEAMESLQLWEELLEKTEG